MKILRKLFSGKKEDKTKDKRKEFYKNQKMEGIDKAIGAGAAVGGLAAQGIGIKRAIKALKLDKEGLDHLTNAKSKAGASIEEATKKSQEMRQAASKLRKKGLRSSALGLGLATVATGALVASKYRKHKKNRLRDEIIVEEATKKSKE